MQAVTRLKIELFKQAHAAAGVGLGESDKEAICRNRSPGHLLNILRNFIAALTYLQISCGAAETFSNGK